MPTIDTCKRLYSAANVAGRFNDAWCAPGPWLRAAELQAGGLFAHIPAAADMGEAAAPAVLQWRPRRELSVAALYQLHMASALQKQRLLLPVAPLGDLLVGRGHRSSLGPAISGGLPVTRLLQAYDIGSRSGLLGAALEALPEGMATAFEHRGHTFAASACLVAAACGRLLLQPLRLLHAVVVLAITYPFAALTLMMTALNMEIKQNRYWQAVAEPMDAAIFISFAVYLGLGSRFLGPGEVTLRPLERFAAVPRMRNNLAFGLNEENFLAHAAWEPRATNNPHERVRRFMRSAIERFNAQQIESDADASRLADTIVGELQRWCAGHADDSAFRGGLNTLQNFMDLTFDDAQWRPNPDYEAVRFIEHALSPLQDRTLSNIRARILADTIAADLRHHFADAPGPKPVQSGLTFLAAYMQECFPDSAWQASPVA